MTLTSSRSRLLIALLVLVAGILMISFTAHAFKKAHRGAISDFQAYYMAAKSLCEKSDPYVFAEKPYIYPPLFATLCMPLAALTPGAAAACYVPLMVAAILLAFLLGTRDIMERFGYTARGPALAICTFIAFLIMEDRVKSDLQMFQVNSLLLCLFVLALRWLDRRPILAGTMLGLAMNIKVFPLIMLPYLLFRKRWKTATAMLASTALFGLLPALVIGWKTNLQYLAQSSGGFLTLLGVQAQVHQKAQIKDITASYSVSIPSGMVRMLGIEHTTLAWSMVGLVLAIVIVFGAWAYSRQRLPRLRWPAGAAQRGHPWEGMVAMEWSLLVAIALIFSPQTNSRHFLMLAPLAMLGAVLVVTTFRLPGWGAAVTGTALLWAGLTLPPGSFRIAFLHDAHVFWQFVGGPSWVLLLALPPLIWSAGRAIRRAGSKASAAQPPTP